MSLNILIVEDQFIEANDLSHILKTAGHTICGIAKSVEQALTILRKNTPDMVLLDIFLKGPQTGIDLAELLSKDNIPFIYLSANSNTSTLEAAKATRPHGFLVKPYRPKDILVALDIANDRHQYALDLKFKQSRWLKEMLTEIGQDQQGPEQKLLALVLAFKAFLPFDHILIDLDVSDDRESAVFNFQRVGYNNYKRLTGPDLARAPGFGPAELTALRGVYGSNKTAAFRNENEFQQASVKFPSIGELSELYHLSSDLSFPLAVNIHQPMMIVFFGTEKDNYHAEHLTLLQPLSALIAAILDDIRVSTTGEIKTAKATPPFEQKNDNPAFKHIIGSSPKLLAALDQVSQVALFDASVLILGETGVGKEGLVKALHLLSARKLKPFIRINCAAIPASLVESELFGHERGAFTGATERRIGKFEQAQGGTIFLDEIGEMPLEVQSKLLRVLQEKELERVGGRNTIKVDVRIVAATNRDLYKEVAAGKFRIDLYYRINVIPITLAPLRERKEDIYALSDHFLAGAARQTGAEKKLSSKAKYQLMQYDWPGNIRELQHVIERSALLNATELIEDIDLPTAVLSDEPVVQQPEFQSIAEIDKAHIITALQKCNGRVSGKGGAAELLKIPSTTLASKMKRLGITWSYLND